MKHFPIILISVLTVISFLLSNCRKYDDDCDPNLFCDTLPYDSGYVTIQSSFKSNGIPIIVYDGYASDNNILFYDTMWADEYSYYLPINNRYAVEAFYKEATSTIIALDGDKLKEESFWNCGDECYEESEIILDVKKL